MYAANDIARYIVDYCTRKDNPVSNLKLQKMLYYLWIEYYKVTKDYLFSDDICAWQFGPVVPEVYYDFCAYGGVPIDRTYDDLPDITQEDISILDRNIELYRTRSVSSLVTQTHQDGLPWDRIYNKDGNRRGKIPFDLIISLECNTKC